MSTAQLLFFPVAFLFTGTSLLCGSRIPELGSNEKQVCFYLGAFYVVISSLFLSTL